MSGGEAIAQPTSRYRNALACNPTKSGIADAQNQIAGFVIVEGLNQYAFRTSPAGSAPQDSMALHSMLNRPGEVQRLKVR